MILRFGSNTEKPHPNDTSTRPEELTFLLHGNPFNQIVFMLKPVTKGGGTCR